MNKKKLFEIMHENTELNAVHYYQNMELGYEKISEQFQTKKERLSEHLKYLNKDWKYLEDEIIEKIFNYSNDENKIIEFLIETFEKNISKISFCLNYFFPNKYVFYNANREIENEIFNGLNFIADINEIFSFKFDKIGEGKDNFEKYIKFNESMINFRDKSFQGSVEEKKL
jgi:hypothetical protein